MTDTNLAPKPLNKPQVAIRTNNITKRFDKVVANDKVCLDVRRGEILALLGENGSGKTTLMNMLSGIYFPDEGDIFVNEQKVVIRSPKDSFDLGIGMVHQHFKLIDVLTAAENIILGLPGSTFINRAKVAQDMKEIADRYGFDIDPLQKVYDMSVSQKQTVEIVKLLYRGVDILILDEPTAVLTPQEADNLFAVLQKMKADGKAIVIITHKLYEVLNVSDRVHILRKGVSIATVDTATTNQNELTDMMVGKSVSLAINRLPLGDIKPKLQLDHISCLSDDGRKVLKDISFTVNSGEILGLAGIAGSGQKELCEALSGLYPIAEGKLLYYQQGSLRDITNESPTQIRKRGIVTAFVPEDRLGMGLVAAMDMTDNVMLRHYYKSKGPFVDRKKSKVKAEGLIDQLAIVTPGTQTPVRLLSGGNVQKVLLGREIALSPKVLIVAYPVRGLDINSSYTIYDMLNEQKKKGVAILFIGEDLDVLLELSDRIAVLCGGELSGIVDARNTTKEEVGLLMTQVGEQKNTKQAGGEA